MNLRDILMMIFAGLFIGFFIDQIKARKQLEQLMIANAEITSTIAEILDKKCSSD